MTKQQVLGTAIIALSLMSVGCASNMESSTSVTLKEAGVIVQATAIGNVLADKQGMTLYTFDKDAQGMSNCYGPCEQKWPPLYSQQVLSGSEYSTVMRKDGTMQVRYKNQPLYLWVGDKQAGDTTGNGVMGVWHVVPAPQ